VDYEKLKSENAAINRDEIAAGARLLRSRPLFFWFDLCGPCNLKCLHCGYRVHGRTSEQDVSEAVYTAVVAELLPAAYVCHLGGTNWGEMTQSRHFQRFLRDCDRHHVAVNLTTNGTRVSDEWLGDLVAVLAVVGFSMEGIDEQFERMRGFKWVHFLRNIERVAQARAAAGKRFRIEWRYCAHADNIHQLPRMVRLAKDLGIDAIKVMELTPYQKAHEPHVGEPLIRRDAAGRRGVGRRGQRPPRFRNRLVRAGAGADRRG